MHTVDCSIKEIDKLGLFNGNKAFNIPAILRSIKNYEQKFYTANENYTKQVQYPLIKGLQKAVEQKTVYTKDGIKIDIWDINPYKYKKYIIFCEGISSEKSHPLQQNTYLKLINAGWGVLAFDYRGRGQSSGQFSQAGARIDVETVYQYLLTGGIAPCNIGIIGHSMGSAIASDFSAKNNVAFTILINPFSKLTTLIQDYFLRFFFIKISNIVMEESSMSPKDNSRDQTTDGRDKGDFDTTCNDGRRNFTCLLDAVERFNHTYHSTKESQHRSDTDEQSHPRKVPFQQSGLYATVRND